MHSKKIARKNKKGKNSRKGSKKKMKGGDLTKEDIVYSELPPNIGSNPTTYKNVKNFENIVQGMPKKSPIIEQTREEKERRFLKENISLYLPSREEFTHFKKQYDYHSIYLVLRSDGISTDYGFFLEEYDEGIFFWDYLNHKFMHKSSNYDIQQIPKNDMTTEFRNFLVSLFKEYVKYSRNEKYKNSNDPKKFSYGCMNNNTCDDVYYKNRDQLLDIMKEYYNAIYKKPTIVYEQPKIVYEPEKSWLQRLWPF